MTVFRGLFTIYIPILYLPTFSESIPGSGRATTFFAKKILKYPGPPLTIKNVLSLNVEVSFQRKHQGRGSGGGGLGGVLASFHNGLYGKTPLERGIFFRLQVYLKEKGFQ